MMHARLLASVVIVAGLFGPSAAVAAERTYVDLQGNAGYSTNPLLELDGRGSGFARLSAFGFHGWNTERSDTSVSAYVANDFYFRRYGNKQSFSLNGNTRRRISENSIIYGGVGFSGDRGGQLSNRFYGVPAGSVSPDPNLPVNLTPPADVIVIVDPTLIGTNQRVYRLGANAGGRFTLSPRSTFGADVSVERVTTSGRSDLNYNLISGAVSYDRQLSERLTVGGRLITSYADYPGSRSISSIGPQATVSAIIGPDWNLSAAVGFVRTHQDGGALGGSSSSIDLALDGSLCRSGEFDRLCVRAARRTQTAVYGGSPTATSASVEYFRRLSAKDTVQASFAALRTTSNFGLVTDSPSTFYTVAGSYDRQIAQRIAAGVNVTARKLTNFGPDPKNDVGGSVFIRYRLGDIQ